MSWSSLGRFATTDSDTRDSALSATILLLDDIIIIYIYYCDIYHIIIYIARAGERECWCVREISYYSYSSDGVTSGYRTADSGYIVVPSTGRLSYAGLQPPAAPVARIINSTTGWR